MYLALALFLATYVLLLIFGKYRAYIAAASALLFVVLGILPWAEVPAAIDWNVLLMIAGTMGTVVLFIESRMPALMADIIMEKVPNIKWAVVALSLFAGLISAFVDNVATVLMVAPVALALAKKLDISPVPVIIAIAVSSNLQGAATLVGDTTSILLGGYADMNFLDFFVFRGRPGIFWVVQVGAVASACVLLYYFRNLRQPVESGERTQVTDTVPTLLLVSTVTLLIIVSFVPEKPAVTNGVICVLLAAVGFLRKAGQRRSLAPLGQFFRELDGQTLLLLASLFVIIAGITRAGVIDAISRLFVNIAGDDRNAFTGTINRIKRGDLLVEVEILTSTGLQVVSIITAESADNLELREGIHKWLIVANPDGPAPKPQGCHGLLHRGGGAHRFNGHIHSLSTGLCQDLCLPAAVSRVDGHIRPHLPGNPKTVIT